MESITRLFEPIDLGPLRLKNRVMMAPCVTFFAKDGFVTDQLLNFYSERARGGVSLVIIEATYPCLSGRPRRLFLFDDKFISGLARLVDAIHREGALAAIQLNPSAGKAQEDQPIYVSLPKNPPLGACELSGEDIDKIIWEFGEGCRRACEAGFDAVQIHGSSGYLIYQFLSPLMNKRKDLYGGTLESRAKFGLRLVEEARKRVGGQKALLFRLCSNDYMEGGFKLSESRLFAQWLEQKGVDSIDVVAGATETSEYIRPGMQLPRCINAADAKTIKSGIRIPVSVAGGINDPYMAEGILRREEADVVSLCRPLIADPFFIRKIADGKTSEIRKCILCNQGCTEYSMIKKTALLCTVNPQVGREGEGSAATGEKHRKVMIIGGGPAGMVAAITAAKKGCRVTLFEKAAGLGGNLSAASGVFFKREIEEFKVRLVRAVERSAVDVELGQEADLALIKRVEPDVLILATGTVPAMPAIPGIEGKNVTDMVNVLSGKHETGARVAVVGGGMMGCETAIFLKGRGKEVVLVDIHGIDQLGLGMESRLRQWFLLTLWPKMGIPFYPYSKAEEVTERGLAVRDQKWGGRVHLLEGDTVVFGIGVRADTRLHVLPTREIVGEIYKIGDCVRPRSILEAVEEGHRVATAI